MRGISTVPKKAVPLDGNSSLIIATRLDGAVPRFVKAAIDDVLRRRHEAVQRNADVSDRLAAMQRSSIARDARPLVCIRTWMPRRVNAAMISGRSLLTKGSPPMSRTMQTPMAARFSATCSI